MYDRFGRLSRRLRQCLMVSISFNLRLKLRWRRSSKGSLVVSRPTDCSSTVGAGMVLRKHKHTQVPVWIRLRHLSVEFWTDDGLSTVASGVGRPLYQYTITRACTRLDFARVCVMLDISSTLPKHLIIMMPREDGTEVPCKVEKRTVQPPVSRPDVTKGADRKPSVAREDGAGVDENGAAHDEVIDKGKRLLCIIRLMFHCSLMMMQVFLTGVLQAAPCLLLRDECRHMECSSEGDRSLWKRLDRLIVNDAWLGQWPCSHYHCLNARTSDHSPLVIRGNTVSHTKEERRPVFECQTRCSIPWYGAETVTTDRHNTLLIRLEKCCKMVFFRATKLEQVMLQQRAKIQWLKGGDQCSRIFFRKVAMRRASKKVFQIANEAGRTLTEQDEVVDEFVSFYQRLLGGDEVVKAILEFFITGRVLKQVNTTMLALIPKINVQRLRLVLDAMINPSQNAFVPGRSIGDNILLAQEMFTGYNRQGLPKRCALKVDLRKAYDTVEWDFLIAALQLFGFPDIFIGWEPSRFFQGC
ncbi:hypothetical protein Sango_3050500 [Sesamum angolense]|uniref:Reverse transcriptase domain-containing protein n=1 Tax=Sesamum angolense TaxID=2727404 RepID=A0AAE1TAQ8_9LAMI|nr:hypothetical protein Sango_3050500 [Sesamum angolense]